MIPSWFSRIFPVPRRSIRAIQRRRSGLTLEQLEDRLVPAARFDLSIGALFIEGDAAANVVDQRVTADGFLDLVIDGQRHSSDIRSSFFDPALAGATHKTIRHIRFDGGAGLDQLRIGGGEWGTGLTVQADDGVTFRGTVTVGGGLRVVAGQVRIEGTIQGKEVDLFGRDRVEVAAGAAIFGHGGVIVLHSDTSAGTTIVAGLVDASGAGPEQRGGTVQVLGHRVGLFGAARIDVSGPAGGGTVLVGGDYQGQGTVPTAAFTFVGSEASITADGGGRVIVWADSATRFHGAIAASGGFVETSGKDYLTIQGGRVQAATWLLDPRNVTIDQVAATSGGTLSGGFFAPVADTSVLDVDDILAALNAGTSVTITTGSDGSQTGDINITAAGAIAKSAGGDATLTLSAARHITLTGGITSTVGRLSILLVADNDNNATGNAVVNSALATNGGTFQATGNAFTGTAAITTAGGDAVLSFQNGVNTDNINVAAGTISIAANQDGAGNQGLTTGAQLNTTNTTANAVRLVVNTPAGGTGGASLRPITTGNGATISVTTAPGGNTAGGSIIRTGTANWGGGTTVNLLLTTGAAGSIGAAATPILTAVGTVIANAGTGGAFFTESNGASFTVNALGGDIVLTNGSNALTIAGASGTGNGNVTLTSNAAIALNAPLNATGQVLINANSTATAAAGFTAAASITTTSTGPNAVVINVNNAAGGTGTAALGNITTGSGGGIVVNTAFGGNITGGSITLPASALLNVGAGSVTLTTPTAGAAGIGTLAARIRTTADLVAATAGSGGFFLAETDAVTLGPVSTTNGPINIQTGGAVTLGDDINAGAGTITFTSADGGSQTGGALKAATLALAGAGPFVFGQLTNDVAALTANIAGAFTYADANFATLGAIAATGGATLAAGTFTLGAVENIADTTPLIVATGAVFDLNNLTETVGSLAGGGNVLLGHAVLTAGGNNASTTFDGILSGAGGAVVKAGTGAWTLTGNNSYGGATIISAGALVVQGNQPASPVTVNAGGTLAGNGTVGPITGNGGTVDPTGTLTAGNVGLSATSVFRVDLTDASTLDQLVVNGTVALGGALTGTLGFAPTPGTVFVLIDNDGSDAVSGTFAGLPEGAVVHIGDGSFAISYVGGSGNDVTLTTREVPVATPQTLTVAEDGSLSITLEGTNPYNGTLTFIIAAGPSHGTLSGTGANRTYAPNPDYNGPDSFTFRVSDGADTSALATISITVTAVNDAPVAAGTGFTLNQVTQNDTNPAGTRILDLIASAGGNPITDVDAGALEGIAVIAADSSNGQWEYSIDGGTAWAPLGTPSTAAARLLAADSLTRIRFVPTTDFIGTVSPALTFHAWDQTSGSNGGTGDVAVNGGITAFSSATATASIFVKALNSPPVLDNSGNPILDPLAEDPVVNPGTKLTDLLASAGSNRITDVDLDPPGIAVIAADSANGQWQYSINGGATWQALGSVSASSARLLAVTDQSLLRFLPAANFNGTVDPAITFRAWDQTAGVNGNLADTSVIDAHSPFSAATETASITITPVNDAPILNAGGTANLGSIAEDDTTNAGTSISDLLGGSVTDFDAGAAQGIAVIAAVTTNGQWQFSTNGGSTWSPLGAVSASNGRLLAADSQTRIRFVPNANFNGLVSSALTFRAWDQTSGANGGLGDPSVNGGVTAFSTASATASITVNSVNDAPVLNPAATVNLTTITEDPAVNPGTAVATLLGSSVTDVDSGALQGIAVIAAVTTNGQWEFSTNGGSTWASLGAVSATSGRLLAANARIRFVPAANFNGTVSPALTYRAWDQTNGTSGGLGNPSVNGGATAFSTATATASITVTPVNDAPVLNPAATGNLAAIDEDETASTGTLVTSLLGASVSDPDAGALQGIAVIGSDTANGRWEFSTDGGTSWSDLRSVAPGSARLLAADALTRVRFIPHANFNGVIDLALTFLAWDRTAGASAALGDASVNGESSAYSAASATAALTVNSINDAPTNAVPDRQSATQKKALTFAAGRGNAISVADVDAAANPLQLVVSVTAGTLTVGNPGGVPGLVGNGTDQLTLTGPLATLNAALEGLVFNPGKTKGEVTLTVATDDQGHSGAPGALQATATVIIHVRPTPRGVIVSGAGSGRAPWVAIQNSASGQVKRRFLAYPANYVGGVRVAAGDINGDGVHDIITGPARGTLGVRVFDGRNGKIIGGPLGSLLAASSGASGGVFLAAGDFNADGYDDVLLGTGQGAPSRVKVISGRDGAVLHDFKPYGDSFTSGARVAAGDVNGDRRADIIIAPGPGTVGAVKVFDGGTGKLLKSFQAAAASYRKGLFVAAGDVNGNGKAEIIIGQGHGAPLVQVFNGQSGALLTRFAAFPPKTPTPIPGQLTWTKGVQVGVTDINRDGRAEIVATAGPGKSAAVRVYRVLPTALVDQFFAKGAPETGGFVGGQ